MFNIYVIADADVIKGAMKPCFYNLSNVDIAFMSIHDLVVVEQILEGMILNLRFYNISYFDDIVGTKNDSLPRKALQRRNQITKEEKQIGVQNEDLK